MLPNNGAVDSGAPEIDVMIMAILTNEATNTTTFDASTPPRLLDQIDVYACKTCHKSMPSMAHRPFLTHIRQPRRKPAIGAEKRNAILHLFRNLGRKIWRGRPDTIGAALNVRIPQPLHQTRIPTTSTIP